jgi:hypothetical protein
VLLPPPSILEIVVVDIMTPCSLVDVTSQKTTVFILAMYVSFCSFITSNKKIIVLITGVIPVKMVDLYGASMQWNDTCQKRKYSISPIKEWLLNFNR